MALVFDSGLGAYVVVGVDDLFFYKGFYYRLHDDKWSISVWPDRRWRPLSRRTLPPGLKGYESAKAKLKPNKHKQGRGHGPPASHR